jgi:hypothetical protein
VSVIEDDLFNSVLAPGTFDLVHASIPTGATWPHVRTS